MSIIHILLELVAIIAFLLIRKNDKKENIILWLALSIIMLMCFNIFITFLFSIIKIKCNLTNLSLGLITIIAIMNVYLIKNKKIQKYYIKKEEIIFDLLLALVISFVAYRQFGFPFSIYYSITDAANHYGAANDFFYASELLNQGNYNDVLGKLKYKTFMTGAYVNLGILFKGLSVFLIKIENFITVSIVFELFVLYLSGVLMYGLLSRKSFRLKQSIITSIFVILYVLGYQLNSEISGFSYLSIGLNIVISTIIIMEYFEKNKLNHNIGLISLFFLNLGLFFSYYFFVPVIYGAIFITIVLDKKKKGEKVINAKKCGDVFVTLFLPFLCGIYYFYLKELVLGNTNIGGINCINVDGAIYFSAISNFLILFPFVVYYMYKKMSRNKRSFLINVTCLFFMFALMLWIGFKFNIVSRYYLAKSYYFLWIIYFIVGYKEIFLLKKILKKSFLKTKNVYIYTIFIILIIIFVKYSNPFDIYKYNCSLLLNRNFAVDNEYFELIDYYNKNLSQFEDEVYIIKPSTIGKVKWFSKLFRNPYIEVEFEFEEQEFKIQNWINGESKEKYIIYNKKDFEYEPFENDDYEILYNNEVGAILKKE